jgi:hypothetical protein
MPIGQADVLIPAGNANLLVESLFDPPVSRQFLTPLIQLVNQSAAQNALAGPVIPTYLGPPPPLAPPAAATAVPFPALGAVPDFVSLLNQVEWQTLLDVWWQIWSNPAGGVVAHASDFNVISMLRNYLADPTVAGVIPPGGIPATGFAAVPLNAPYVMWLPQYSYDGTLGDQLKLRLTGYQSIPLATLVGGPPALAWNQANVLRFLNLFACGAHFVVIHAPGDFAGMVAPPAAQPFYTQFGTLLGNQSTAARMHSHYSGYPGLPLSNLGSSYAYPSLVNSETTPALCPYVVAMLVGRTAWAMFGNNYNTFFQLEGWPAYRVNPAGRHMADFKTHSATKWNLSTYGASLYSEKRGMTIFLAPAGWKPPGGPQPDPATIMTPYVGAGTLQGWLDTKLVRI